jgi:hypothetical protein
MNGKDLPKSCNAGRASPFGVAHGGLCAQTHDQGAARRQKLFLNFSVWVVCYGEFALLGAADRI